MTTTSARYSEPACGFDAVQSPDHDLWRKHRQLLLRIDPGQIWRGCLGLSFLPGDSETWIEHGDRLFVPDKQAYWLSLVDLPRGRFCLARTREVHWAELRRTRFVVGMPTISGQPAYLGGQRGAWDFRSMPFDRIKRGDYVVRVGPDTLNSADFPQLFRILNALNWGMTSTAFFCRSSWEAEREAFYTSLGAPFKPLPAWAKEKLFLFGEGLYDHVPRPQEWMPRPYLAFRAAVSDKIWQWVIRARPCCADYYPIGLRAQFAREVAAGVPVLANCSGRYVGAVRTTHYGIKTWTLTVDAGPEAVPIVVSRRAEIRILPGSTISPGVLVAVDPLVPTNCQDLDKERWHEAIQLWFERQVLHLVPGLVHVPAELAAPAARGGLSTSGRAIDASLLWDVTSSRPYYNDACDAFILPTLHLRLWHWLSGVLPGEVAYDLTPADPRYRSPSNRPPPATVGGLLRDLRAKDHARKPNHRNQRGHWRYHARGRGKNS